MSTKKPANPETVTISKETFYNLIRVAYLAADVVSGTRESFDRRPGSIYELREAIAHIPEEMMP